MKPTLPKIVFALAALLFTARPLPVHAAPPHTGIQGQALLTISHGLGVEVAPGIWIAPPSVTQPVAASFTVRSARNGREMARVTTDASGFYQLTLPPGDYVLVPDPITFGLADCSISLAPIAVTVRARQFAPANLFYFHLGFPCSIQAE